MKLPYLPAFISLVLAMNAGAAIYSSDFNSFPLPGEAEGNDSWIINDGGDDISFTVNYNDLTNPTSTAVALGGLNQSAAQATVGLSHSYGEELGRTTTTFGFSLIDTFGAGNLRDKFSFSFYNGTSRLFSVIFTPSQVDPTLDIPGEDPTWHLSYTANGGPEQDLFLDVFDDAPYTFSLAFRPQTTETGGTFTLGAPSGPFVRNVSGFNLAPSTVISDFALEWTPTNLASGGGRGYIIMDNLTVVPEPSSSLLVGLAGLAFISNRRRRA